MHLARDRGLVPAAPGAARRLPGAGLGRAARARRAPGTWPGPLPTQRRGADHRHPHPAGLGRHRAGRPAAPSGRRHRPGKPVGHRDRQAPRSSTRRRTRRSGQAASPQPRSRVPPGSSRPAGPSGPWRSPAAQPAPRLRQRGRAARSPQRQAAPPAFADHIGLPLKALQAVLRFQRLRVQLASPGTAQVTLARAAADCGYFDQAHLCHDSARLAGITPTELLCPRSQPTAGTRPEPSAVPDELMPGGHRLPGSCLPPTGLSGLPARKALPRGGRAETDRGGARSSTGPLRLGSSAPPGRPPGPGGAPERASAARQPPAGRPPAQRPCHSRRSPNSVTDTSTAATVNAPASARLASYTEKRSERLPCTPPMTSNRACPRP